MLFLSVAGNSVLVGSNSLIHSLAPTRSPRLRHVTGSRRGRGQCIVTHVSRRAPRRQAACVKSERYRLVAAFVPGWTRRGVAERVTTRTVGRRDR